MNSRILSFYLLLSIACSSSVCHASNFGLKSKTIIGLFAAAGSALATGASHVANSFKENKLSNAQLKISQLENQISAQYASRLMDEEYAEGLATGVIATILIGALIVAIACNPVEPDLTSPNVVLGEAAYQAQNNLNDKQELIVKA